MATVVIFGAGVMGSATAFPLTNNGHQVRLVGTHLDGGIVEEVKQRRFHPSLKRTLPEGVTAFEHSDLGEALDGADFVVSGVNSYGVHWAAERLATVLERPIPIIAITKGLDSDENGELVSLTTAYEQTLRAAGGPECSVAGVGGPCIAGELAARRQSCVVFGAPAMQLAEWFASFFGTRYYHIRPTEKLLALEITAALKNAYTLSVAIATGFATRPENEDSVGAQMHNLAAAVFGQAVSEIAYVLRAFGQDESFAASLPGAGDYYVTCAGGRNMRFGRLMGAGMTKQQALKEMDGVTIESLSIIGAMARALPKLYARSVLEKQHMPLMEHLIHTVDTGEAEPFPVARFRAGIT